ncbi:MAG: hypothetical protein ABI724_12505 [Betaproteobacteria bacterium]
MRFGTWRDGMRVGAIRGLAALVLVSALAGCASTSIRSAWFDPSYKGGSFKRILVAGIGGALADRRVFEDIFAQKLKAVGVDGLPGYQFATEEARGTEASWNAAIAKSGADGLLLVQVLGVDTRTQVSTMLVPASPWGFGPYGGWWGGPAMVAVPDVQQYDIATVETRLFDVATKRLVWVGTTETFNPKTVAAETPGFADVIIGQLAARGLVPGALK